MPDGSPYLAGCFGPFAAHFLPWLVEVDTENLVLNGWNPTVSVVCVQTVESPEETPCDQNRPLVSLGRLRARGVGIRAIHGRGALASRRGAKRAQVAVAHSILVSAYYMLEPDEPYHDLGPAWLQRHHDKPTPAGWSSPPS